MKKKSLNTRLELMYLIALIPLFLFGFYKNGISLYYKDYINYLNMFKPIIMLLIAVSGAIIGCLIREKTKEKITFKTLVRCKSDILEALLVTCILPIDTSPLVVLLVTFLSTLFLKKVKFNRIALMYILIEGINVILGLNEFRNAYEMNTVLNYNGLDLFGGLGPGGIFSTNILLIVIALVFLSFNKLYKRELVYSSLGTFLLLGIVPFMIKEQYTNIFPYIFGYNILFVLVFIGPNVCSSSYTVKGQVLSGILTGILTYAISFLTPYTAAIIAVLLVSLASGVLDRIFVIK